ncbi:hypothetical protein Tco_1370446 [Tanacetum coccineum]
MNYAKGKSWALLLSIYKWSRQRAPLEQKAASCKHYSKSSELRNKSEASRARTTATMESAVTIKKYKGPAKDKVTPEWFEKQYVEPSRRVQVKVDAKLRIDWESLEIKNQEIIFSLGLKEGSKRKCLEQGTYNNTTPHSSKIEEQDEIY